MAALPQPKGPRGHCLHPGVRPAFLVERDTLDSQASRDVRAADLDRVGALAQGVEGSSTSLSTN
jgi:hypothetical protein